MSRSSILINIFLLKNINKYAWSPMEPPTAKRGLIWFRYIDDVFFIWTHGEEELWNFLPISATTIPLLNLRVNLIKKIYRSWT